MRPYEVVIIYEPGLDEDSIRTAVDRSTGLVRSRGGTVGRVDKWGKRRLAYEIRHHREGYYVLVETSAEPAVMAGLDRSLYLADEVLRHKVVRVPDKVAGKARRATPGPDTGPPAGVAAPGAAESSAQPNGA